MSEYLVVHLNDDGTEGAKIGAAPSMAAAREIGDEQAADPDYPWYRVYRGAEIVEDCQSYHDDFYSPERDGVPPPDLAPGQRATWPRPVARTYLRALREAKLEHDPPL